MSNRITQLAAAMVLAMLAPQALADSYRYLHVTIETPSLIFLGLMVAVMLPFIVMAILYWHNAFRRNAEDDAKAEGKGGE
jgi:hypothetical protein